MDIVRRIALDQQSWLDTIHAALAPTMEVHGLCEQIEVKINDNTNARTATLTITSKNGGTLFTQAGIAHNAATVYKATSDSTDFDAFLADELCTFTILPSEDPGATGMTVDVVLYLRDVA
jgi:hypothetical protein